VFGNHARDILDAIRVDKVAPRVTVARAAKKAS